MPARRASRPGRSRRGRGRRCAVAVPISARVDVRRTRRERRQGRRRQAGRAEPRNIGRSRAAVSWIDGARPVSAATAWPSGRGSRVERAMPYEALADGLFFALLERGRDADDAREQEEAEAQRQEHVAERGDVLEERDRDRDDVAEDQQARTGSRSSVPSRPRCGAPT